ERAAAFGGFQSGSARVLRAFGADFSPAAAGAVGPCRHFRLHETRGAPAPRGGGRHPSARAAARLSALTPPECRLERFPAKHALGLDPGVGTGSREENASKQKTRASVPIQSERKRLWGR